MLSPSLKFREGLQHMHTHGKMTVIFVSDCFISPHPYTKRCFPYAKGLLARMVEKGSTSVHISEGHNYDTVAWNNKLSLHVLRACLSLIIIWINISFLISFIYCLYKRDILSLLYIDKWKQFQSLKGNIYIYIKIEKASHLLENDFIYQQPPLPLPFSSCASPHAAWLLHLHLSPMLGLVTLWKTRLLQKSRKQVIIHPSSLRGQILHESSACAVVLELPLASVMPELKLQGWIDRDVRSAFSLEVN